MIPGCRRHDVVQDAQDDCKFSFYKIFDDQQAFDDHKKTDSFAVAHTDEAKAAWVDGRVSFTSPIFPTGDVNWDSVEQPGPPKGLYVYHAALAFHPDRDEWTTPSQN